MLDDTGVGHFCFGVVHHRVALVVGHVEHLIFETDGAILKVAQTVIEIFVYLTTIHQLSALNRKRRSLNGVDAASGIIRPLTVEEVYIHLRFYALQQSVYQLVISPDGYSLIGIVEVVVVENQPHRQPLNDKCGQLGALPSPLLLGVALDEPFVDVAPDEHKRLFLQVAGLVNAVGLHFGHSFGTLLVEFGLCLCRRGDTPHLIKSVHVERQVVEPSLVVGHRRVGVTVEFHDGVHKVPHPFAVGMEDVGTILVDIDTFYILAIDVAAEMLAFINHQTFLPLLLGKVGKSSSKQTGTYNKIIVQHFL